MKSTELRIGNYINHANITCEVYDISEDYLQITNNQLNTKIEDIEPIPLTEEWLEKLGFNGKYKSCHIHWNNGGFGLDQASDEDDFGNPIEPTEVFYYDHNLAVEYVHQLQNLCFALTGKELELKV